MNWLYIVIFFVWFGWWWIGIFGCCKWFYLLSVFFMFWVIFLIVWFSWWILWSSWLFWVWSVVMRWFFLICFFFCSLVSCRWRVWFFFWSCFKLGLVNGFGLLGSDGSFFWDNIVVVWFEMKFGVVEWKCLIFRLL